VDQYHHPTDDTRLQCDEDEMTVAIARVRAPPLRAQCPLITVIITVDSVLEQRETASTSTDVIYFND